MADTKKPKTPRPLSSKMQRFVDEYLVDLNATQAAIRAKYSPKTAAFIGAENLKKPKIQAAISEAQKKLSDKTGITVERVLNELAIIGFADMADFVTINSLGNIVANQLDSLSAGKSRTIKKVKERRTVKTTSEGDSLVESFYEFELHDKIKSLEMIGKHLGMFNDKPIGDDETPEATARKMREAAIEMKRATNAADK